MYSFEPTEEQQSIIDTVRDFAKMEMRPKSMEADEKDHLPEGFLQNRGISVSPSRRFRRRTAAAASSAPR